MVVYEFEHEPSGDVIEREYRSDERPDAIKHKGRTYRRIISRSQGKKIAIKPTVHGVVSRALPRKWKYADNFDDTGRPVFRSRKHIRECLAKANHDGEPAVYDD